MEDFSQAGADAPISLSPAAAARHIGFLLQAFNKWVRNGLLPPADPNIGGWTRAALDQALDRLARDGLQLHSQDSKKRDCIVIPNTQRQPRKNSLGIKKFHYYRRGARGALSGEPGSPEFMQGLINKERCLALSTSAERLSNGSSKPTIVASPSVSPQALEAVPPTTELQSEILDFTADELLTIEELVARYKGRIAGGTWANHRAQKTGPAYLRIAREIFYPLPLLLKWERRHLVLCDLTETSRSEREHGGV